MITGARQKKGSQRGSEEVPHNIHNWTQTRQWQPRTSATHVALEDRRDSRGTANMRPGAVWLSFAWLTAQSVSILIGKWGFHCADEQRTEGGSFLFQTIKWLFPVSSPFAMVSLSLSLWFMSLWVTPCRPAYRLWVFFVFVCFSMNNLWIFIITLTSLCPVEVTAAPRSYLLFGYLLCSEVCDSITSTCCFIFLQLRVFFSKQLNVITICCLEARYEKTKKTNYVWLQV